MYWMGSYRDTVYTGVGKVMHTWRLCEKYHGRAMRIVTDGHSIAKQRRERQASRRKEAGGGSQRWKRTGLLGTARRQVALGIKWMNRGMKNETGDLGQV